MSDENTNTAIAQVIDTNNNLATSEKAVIYQVEVIDRLMESVMKKGQHFDVVPGCGTKPTLLQPGAEKLALAFRLALKPTVKVNNLERGHREYVSTTEVRHADTGVYLGSAEAVCSTMETRYRFRTKTTPTGQPIPSDYQQNKGSYAERGFKAAKVNGQWVWAKVERVEHDNPADYWNTCCQIAQKRSNVRAVRQVTACSDIFTQDIEDLADLHDDSAPTFGVQHEQAKPQQQRPQAQTHTQEQHDEHSPEPEPDKEPAGNVITVSDVKEKTGTSKTGKPWTLYIIHAGDGRSFGTFDVNHANVARECMEKGITATIDAVANSRGGHDLKDIQPGNGADPGAAESGNPQVIDAAIQSYDGPLGKSDNVWGVNTSEGRFGVIGDGWPDILNKYIQTGEVVRITYETDKRGRRMVRIDEIAEPSADSDTPW